VRVLCTLCKLAPLFRLQICLGRRAGTRARGGTFSIRQAMEARMIRSQDIKEHMEVVGNDGGHVGIVDGIDPDGEIKLSRNDTPDRLHHFLPLATVEYVDDRVHLNRSSTRAMAEWR